MLIRRDIKYLLEHIYIRIFYSSKLWKKYFLKVYYTFKVKFSKRLKIPSLGYRMVLYLVFLV